MKQTQKIYTLCNEIDTDLTQYEIHPVSDLDKKRMYYTAKQIAKTYPKQTKEKSHRKWVAAACTAFLVCGVLLTDSGSRAVYAAGETVAYHISNFLGIDRNLSDYAAVIGTEQTDNGYTIRLNEVILDQNTLIVSTDVYKTDKEGNVTEEVPMGIPIGDVYINGRNAAKSAGGGARYDAEGNAMETLIEYHLDDRIDTSEALDIKLVYHTISVQEGRPSGLWEFHFAANGSTLAGDTLEIPLNYVVKAEKDTWITFHRYTRNVLGERIYYSIDGKLNKEITLQGVDEQGNEVVFLPYVYEGNYAGTKGSGYMKPYSVEMITDETKTLTLAPYLAEEIVTEEGKHLSGEAVQAGEAFTIECDCVPQVGTD